MYKWQDLGFSDTRSTGVISLKILREKVLDLGETTVTFIG